MTTLPRNYDFWAALVAERAPNPDDVVTLTAAEWDELARLRGTRRRPRLMFGRRITVEKAAAA